MSSLPHNNIRGNDDDKSTYGSMDGFVELHTSPMNDGMCPEWPHTWTPPTRPAPPRTIFYQWPTVDSSSADDSSSESKWFPKHLEDEDQANAKASVCGACDVWTSPLGPVQSVPCQLSHRPIKPQAECPFSAVVAPHWFAPNPRPPTAAEPADPNVCDIESFQIVESSVEDDSDSGSCKSSVHSPPPAMAARGRGDSHSPRQVHPLRQVPEESVLHGTEEKNMTLAAISSTRCSREEFVVKGLDAAMHALVTEQLNKYEDAATDTCAIAELFQRSTKQRAGELGSSSDHHAFKEDTTEECSRKPQQQQQQVDRVATQARFFENRISLACQRLVHLRAGQVKTVCNHFKLGSEQVDVLNRLFESKSRGILELAKDAASAATEQELYRRVHSLPCDFAAADRVAETGTKDKTIRADVVHTHSSSKRRLCNIADATKIDASVPDCKRARVSTIEAPRLHSGREALATKGAAADHVTKGVVEETPTAPSNGDKDGCKEKRPHAHPHPHRHPFGKNCVADLTAAVSIKSASKKKRVVRFQEIPRVLGVEPPSFSVLNNKPHNKPAAIQNAVGRTSPRDIDRGCPDDGNRLEYDGNRLE